MFHAMRSVASVFIAKMVQKIAFPVGHAHVTDGYKVPLGFNIETTNEVATSISLYNLPRSPDPCVIS